MRGSELSTLDLHEIARSGKLVLVLRFALDGIL